MADETSPYMQAHDMGDAIKSGQIAIHWGGHYASGHNGKNPKCRDLNHIITKIGSAIHMTLDDAEIARLYAAWMAATPLAEPITIGPDYVENCWECGEDFGIVTDGVNWKATKCRHPDGIGPMIFEVNVPSGKMIVANDLRDLFPVLSDHDINQPHGILLTVQDYAKIGLAHCFVGNSCPAMYECRDGKRPCDSHFVIGTTSNRDKAPRFHSDDRVNRVAGISTDLWWYSICDADEFVKRTGKSLEESAKIYDADIVPCVPGVYQFRHVHHLLREKRDDFKVPHVYTYIKRKRKPDPLVDYMAAYRDLHLTAEQIIADKLKHWPSLYAESYSPKPGKKVLLPPDEQYARVAGQLMMVIGGGDSYHPNGFWGGESWMTADSPAVEVVTLDKAYNWYPGSENYCAISHIAGLSERIKKPLVVNDSFIALAFNVCRCILTHGVTDYQTKDESHSKNAFAFAKKCMAALKKRYPDKIPANCVDIVETKTPYVFKELRG